MSPDEIDKTTIVPVTPYSPDEIVHARTLYYQEVRLGGDLVAYASPSPVGGMWWVYLGLKPVTVCMSEEEALLAMHIHAMELRESSAKLRSAAIPREDDKHDYTRPAPALRQRRR